MWERKNSFEKDVSSCILECLINGNAVPCFLCHKQLGGML